MSVGDRKHAVLLFCTFSDMISLFPSIKPIWSVPKTVYLRPVVIYTCNDIEQMCNK